LKRKGGRGNKFISPTVKLLIITMSEDVGDGAEEGFTPLNSHVVYKHDIYGEKTFTSFGSFSSLRKREGKKGKWNLVRSRRKALGGGKIFTGGVKKRGGTQAKIN